MFHRVVLGALALVLLGAALAGAGADRQVRRTEELLILTVPGPFEDVLDALRAAIERRNYTLGATSAIDDALRRRAADLGERVDFAHYKILSFCNLTFAAAALRADPHVGALLPCRVTVWARAGGQEVVLAAVRPTFLARAFRSPEFERLAAEVEADIVAILEAVAGD
ncbi:MAG: DUF302 domain-containing protein [Candidatus Rokubacteria bacterium]|nr:DUF302 domain-containing protein [Candidatus Rokubacteria bacterium]